MPTVQPVTLDRDSLARWYAISHLKTDPGIVEVHYLPTGSDDNEIRFVEVNTLIEGRRDDSIEVIDFGIDFGKETYHRLLVWMSLHHSGRGSSRGRVRFHPGGHEIIRSLTT